MDLCLSRFRVAVASAALLIHAAAHAGETATPAAGQKIAGQVGDIHDYSDSSGYRFQVALRNLSYVGQADRTVLERRADGSLTVWLAFRDIHLTIGQISMSGQPGSATCGPTALHIGQQREVWVAFDFQRDADASQSLTFAGSRCQIANDNWAIGSPAWVQTSGLFLSRGKVANGVRSGLAGKRERIELELQHIAYAVLGKSCTDTGEAPADHDAFETAVASRLVRDGYLSTSPSPSGSISFPLTGFVQEAPDTTRRE